MRMFRELFPPPTPKKSLSIIEKYFTSQIETHKCLFCILRKRIKYSLCYFPSTYKVVPQQNNTLVLVNFIHFFFPPQKYFFLLSLLIFFSLWIIEAISANENISTFIGKLRTDFFRFVAFQRWAVIWSQNKKKFF